MRVASYVARYQTSSGQYITSSDVHSNFRSMYVKFGNSSNSFIIGLGRITFRDLLRHDGNAALKITELHITHPFSSFGPFLSFGVMVEGADYPTPQFSYWTRDFGKASSESLDAPNYFYIPPRRFSSVKNKVTVSTTNTWSNVTSLMNNSDGLNLAFGGTAAVLDRYITYDWLMAGIFSYS